MACFSSFVWHRRALRSVSLVMALWFAASSAARPDILPVPESAQAAQALRIIDAYHGPRPAKPPKILRILYYTPADREPEPNCEQRLVAIMEDIHGFYRDGMERLGFGPKSFPMERDGAGKLVIHLVKGKSLDASFPLWEGKAGSGAPAGGDKVIAECQPAFQAAGISLDRETVLIFCNLANWDEKAKTFRHHSPYYGSWDRAGGLCFAADSLILNLDDGGYKAPTATSVPDSHGQFAIEVSDLEPVLGGKLRVEFCHANGAISERKLGFAVTPEGSVDLSQMRQALEPVAHAIESANLDAARAALAELEKSDASQLTKTIARKAVGTLDNAPKPRPVDVPAEITEVFLGDMQPQAAEVGWGTPAANRIPKNEQIDSPFLDCGTLHATGFFAHSPSRYVFDLGGKWRTLRGQAGLHTALQPYAYGVRFLVKADGREAFRSPVIRGSKKANYEIGVAGVKTIELIVDKAGERNGGNWGLWLDPALVR